jgi:glucokinase
MLLAGDVGGTKTRLAVFDPQKGPRAPLFDSTFPSAGYPSLEALVAGFLAGIDVPVERASLGVPGPVVDGRAEITNLPWVVDEEQMRQTLGLDSVSLLNDLVATAYAIPFLEPGDLYTLNEGRRDRRGVIAVIAPGTGLGEGFLTWDGDRYQPHPSEGGHASFGPTSDIEVGLLRYLMERFGHVSYERVASGLGLPNIYDYLKESGYAEEPSWLAERLAGARDRAPVIVEAAFDRERPCELCAATLDLFVSILGNEAANLALKVLATGGVYLAGGIPPRILPALTTGRFLRAFLSKGRFADLMARIPLHVVLHPAVALLGAAYHGFQQG